jgi:membrane fusion protein, multidrug efflux system
MNEKDEKSKVTDKVKTAPRVKKKKKELKLIIILIIIILVILSGILYYYYETTHYVTTDDAHISGHPVYISPHISGYVKKVHVKDNENVKKGQLLIEIDERPFVLQLKQKKAELEVSRAKLDAANAMYKITIDAQNTAAVDMHRNQILMAGTMTGSAVSQEKFEHTISLYEAAVSEVKSAKANIKLAQSNVNEAIVNVQQAELTLSYAKIFAPENGYVTKKYINNGSYITQGKPLMVLVSNNKWIKANFKETQLTHMRIGQSVDLLIDSYPNITFKGKVESIQAGTGSIFSLLPPENATGNYVKVVQRVPVKIVFDSLPKQSEYFLALGMSVVPTVKIK